MRMDPVVITSALRTPIGRFQGVFAQTPAPQLAGQLIAQTLATANLDPNRIQEIYLGCVLSAGLGQAPARQAAFAGGLPVQCGATTLNKMCGSGMKTIMLAADLLQSSPASILLAGGMENMSRAPYLLAKARAGYRLGHGALHDHLFIDGLEDAYDSGRLMGGFADDTATKYHISRQQQDAFAIQSIHKAQNAQNNGYFDDEICPITVIEGNTKNLIQKDEGPLQANIDKLPHLRPAFHPDGSVTAANASAIADGAAMVSLMRASQAAKCGLDVLATLVGHSSHAQAPEHFTTAPVGAIRSLLKKIDWDITSVDIFEINEAFAVVTLATMQLLNLPPEKVNVHGGACILGHPLGASGARVLVTLIHAMKRYQLKRGIATLCIGGGEAIACAIEMNQ